MAIVAGVPEALASVALSRPFFGTPGLDDDARDAEQLRDGVDCRGGIRIWPELHEKDASRAAASSVDVPRVRGFEATFRQLRDDVLRICVRREASDCDFQDAIRRERV